MSALEPLWYEVSPYVYTAGGALALAQTGSGLGMVSGALLLAAAALVLRMRWVHRNTRALQKKKTRR